MINIFIISVIAINFFIAGRYYEECNTILGLRNKVKFSLLLLSLMLFGAIIVVAHLSLRYIRVFLNEFLQLKFWFYFYFTKNWYNEDEILLKRINDVSKDRMNSNKIGDYFYKKAIKAINKRNNYTHDQKY